MICGKHFEMAYVEKMRGLEQRFCDVLDMLER